MNQTGQPFLIATSCENNLVFYQPGGEIYLELPEKIRLSVIARNDRWLHVKITPNITGFIHSRCVNILGYGDRISRGVFGGFNSKFEDDWLVFSFNLRERVPFKVIQKQDPQRIELLLYNSHVRNEWTVLPRNDSVLNPESSFLKHFEWKQITDSELMLTFYLNTIQQWGYRGWYEDNLFKLAIRKPPLIESDSLFKNLIIALDAGHGGEHYGAVGATGYTEKEAVFI